MSGRLTVGLDDLKGLVHLNDSIVLFYDSVIVWAYDFSAVNS